MAKKSKRGYAFSIRAVEDFPRMKEVIESVSDNEKYAAGREKYRNESWQIIGNSAANIVDYLLEKNNSMDA